MRIDNLSRTSLVVAATTAAAMAALLACGDGAKECRLGADCASGKCSADGLCVIDGASGDDDDDDTTSSSGSQSSGSSGNVSSGGGSSGSTSSSSGSHSSTSSSGSVPGCVPNMDGVITKDEVPQVAGLAANFRFASDVDIDMTGTPEGDLWKWDLTGPFEGDYDVPELTKPVAGSWFQSDFPTGVYTALLGKVPAEGLGVLRPDDNALSLLGIVSNSDTQPSSGETNMQYDKPVHTVEFPLELGKKWTVENASGSGLLAGYDVPLYGTVTDTYTSEVDKKGALTTPYGIFPVLRIRTVFHRSSTNILLISDSVTVAFVTECGGTIAKVSSDDTDADAKLGNFKHAVEIQRLAIPAP